MTGASNGSAETVLVTGGAGYIGSHTCKALARAGYVPVTLDNLSRGHSSAVKWGPLIKGSVGDRAVLDNAFARHRPVAVLHFAAFAYVGESVSNPSLYYRNNTCSSLTLLEAMRDHNVGAVVFSSTCATYGIPQSLPIHEGDAQIPVNPYGESKLMVERMLTAFDSAHRLRSVALRYFNAAGSDRDVEIGWHHDPETRLIPRALMAAGGDISHLEVFGDDFDTADGTCVRDYIHVSDLAKAHVLALRYLMDGHPSVALNVGTGVGYSVRDVVDAAERVTGKHVHVLVGPRRTGDPPVLVADPSLARRLLGFTPTESSLEHISSTAWRWLQHRSTVRDPRTMLLERDSVSQKTSLRS
jgi:UDP-arabinose 4-epimerase